MALEPAKLETVMDWSALPVAGAYAEALLGLAPSDEQAESLAEELTGLAELLDRISGAVEILVEPQLSEDHRVALVQRVVAGRVSKTMEGFLVTLARHGRMGLLRLVAQQFRKALNRRENKLDVTVTSAVELDEAQRLQIEQTLRQAMNCGIVLSVQTDPDLLGGMLLRIGDRVYDASVSGSLKRLREDLASKRSLIAASAVGLS